MQHLGAGVLTSQQEPRAQVCESIGDETQHMGRSTTHWRRREEVHHSMCSRVDPGVATDVETLGQCAEYHRQLGPLA